MALALGLSASVPFRDELIVMTFSVVLSSLLIQGLSVGKLLLRLGLVERDETRKALNILQAELFSSRAVLTELENNEKVGHLPPAALLPLKEEYSGRLKRVEQEIENIWLKQEALQRIQEREARAVALKVERVALQEALSRGLLDESSFHERTLGIDKEIDSLTHD